MMVFDYGNEKTKSLRRENRTDNSYIYKHLKLSKETS